MRFELKVWNYEFTFGIYDVDTWARLTSATNLFFTSLTKRTVREAGNFDFKYCFIISIIKLKDRGIMFRFNDHRKILKRKEE